MPVETELKLHIAPGQLNQLKRHPLLKTLTTARATNQKLYSVYYDTPKLDLQRHGMALRLRRAGRRWLQTLKGGGSVRAGLHQRNEWETPVPSGQLDFWVLRAGGAPLPRGIEKKLQLVFVTDFARNARLLHFEGAEIELCMDSGEIRAEERTRPISELELELKSGEPQQLFRLALALLDIVPLEVEQVNKAEYGYRLFGGGRPAVRKASFPELDKSQDMASALQSMIASCLQHAQANVPGAILNLDEEFLHQVRVGLRRLRVVLAMAEAFKANDELHALHEEVARMCVEFGRLREWDVFVTQTLASIRERLPQHPGLIDVLDASEKIRKQHHAEMVEELQSQEYQRFLLRFGAWMTGPYWRTEGLTSLPDFALQILEKRSRQVAKRGQNLGDADPVSLHALRIACKKLRYSAEMFGSLFAEGKTRRYVAALSALQDIMGALNDIAVAHRLLDTMDDKKHHDTITLIRGWMEHDYAERLAELGMAWKQFSGQKAFWT
jgi:inorganic triphosphatase YgiF